MPRILLPDLSELARNIEFGEDGIWAARSVSGVSYPPGGNDACFAIEESSFWFRHRNHCILEALKAFPPAGAFFDVGGGNGYIAWAIQNAGLETVLVEPGLSGARNALKRGVRHVVRATLEDAEFLPEALPAVGLFDVIEHIEDDRAYLAEIHRLTAPGGRIYLTVPAFEWLWSHEDKDAGHWRRYTARSVSHAIEEAGFSVEFATYFFGFLPLPILLLRVVPSKLGFARNQPTWADHELSNRLVKRALQALMHRELSRIAARQPCAWGGSCLVVARKQ